MFLSFSGSAPPPINMREAVLPSPVSDLVDPSAVELGFYYNERAGVGVNPASRTRT
jgi:hypothetical protein